MAQSGVLPNYCRGFAELLWELESDIRSQPDRRSPGAFSQHRLYHETNVLPDQRDHARQEPRVLSTINKPEARGLVEPRVELVQLRRSNEPRK